MPEVTPNRGHARWIIKVHQFQCYDMECSNCHNNFTISDDLYYKRNEMFCPYCGCKMDSEFESYNYVVTLSNESYSRDEVIELINNAFYAGKAYAGI